MRLSRLAAIAVLTAACNDPGGPSSGTPRITALPRTLSSGEQTVISASNEFGFNLLRELEKTRGDSNIFMSPASRDSERATSLIIWLRGSEMV